MVSEVRVKSCVSKISVLRKIYLLTHSGIPSSDSCKFLHDRSDYKHGWQIERELEEGRYGAGSEFQPPPQTGPGCCWLNTGLLSFRRGELRGEQR